MIRVRTETFWMPADCNRKTPLQSIADSVTRSGKTLSLPLKYMFRMLVISAHKIFTMTMGAD